MVGSKKWIPVSLGAAVALALSGLPAQAQSTADTSNDQLEEVVVTGSLIRRAAAETSEAVTVLKADVLKAEGVQTIEQALNMLTSNNPSINIAAAVGTFSGGGTYADLRGLGNGRTLVLLDGQRLANNANSGNAVDLSGIPFSAIDSIQILREGASAEYGSDAISGVINFITKKNYQGLEVQGTFDRPQENGGNSGQGNISWGTGDLKSDGYNLLVTASYSKSDELRATQRGFSQAGFYPGNGYYSTNDPGTWPASIVDSNGNYYQSGYPACSGNPFLTTYFGNCAYRYSAATDLQPESEEYSGLVSFTKTLPANNQIQVQYFWTRSEVTGWSGPMFYYFQMDPASPYYPTPGQLTCITAYSANCAQAPDLADPIDAIWSDPLNNRYSGNINLEQRLLLTFSGNNLGFDYNADANFSQNNNNNRNVGGYPNEAVLAPGGILSTLINPFGPQSAQGQALINGSYINGTYSLGTDKRWSLDGNVSHKLGDWFNMGTQSTLAIGADVGGEKFAEGTTPYNTLVQAATGLGDSSVSGSRTTQAVFAELDIPIGKKIDLDVSDREDRYSDFGKTNNGKVALQYSPIDMLKFRGTASTGFRAPTLYDLYSPAFLAASSSGTMGQGNPYCSAGNYTVEWSQSVCNTQGLGLYGGNSSLTPEKSKNYDFGVVISPLTDMGITLDYYRIVVTNTIGSVPVSAIYGNPNGFGNLIHLATTGPNAGSLTPSIEEAANCTPPNSTSCGYVELGFSNTGEVETNGIDVSFDYSQRTSVGTFHEDLEGNMVTQFETQQYTGGPFLNTVGWFNELSPAYRWQHNLRFDWTSPQGMWTGELTNRYYSSYIDEYPNGAGAQRMVGSYSLWNADVSVKPISQLTLLFGIKNLFNTPPPFTNAFEENFAAGYNPLTADPLLRNFYINVSYKFW